MLIGPESGREETQSGTGGAWEARFSWWQEFAPQEAHTDTRACSNKDCLAEKTTDVGRRECCAAPLKKASVRSCRLIDE